MNDVWEGNNVAQAFIEEEKKKDKNTKVTQEQLCVTIAIFKPLLFVSLNKTTSSGNSRAATMITGMPCTSYTSAKLQGKGTLTVTF